MTTLPVLETGCFADGSFGHEYVRRKLALMVDGLGYKDLAVDLRGPMSDDGYEEDLALEILNENLSDDKTCFVLEDGDLKLVFID